jgi:hypothetical protein
MPSASTCACARRPKSRRSRCRSNAAISYYESSALPWERAAFIRARHAAGDAEVGRYFLEAIHPFVWRRSLDFGAIGEIQAITRQIRDHYAHGQAVRPRLRPEARPRRHSRNRVLRADPPAHPRRPRAGAARAGHAGRAAALAAAGRIAAGRGGGAGRELPAAAHDRAPAADGRRPPDPQLPADAARSTMSRGSTGSPTARRCSPARAARGGGGRASTTALAGEEERAAAERTATRSRRGSRARLRRSGGGAAADRGWRSASRARCAPPPRATRSRRCCRRWSTLRAARPIRCAR